MAILYFGGCVVRWIYKKYGNVRDLIKENGAPIPIPKDGEILIKIETLSVNPIDWKLMQGRFRFLMPLKFPVVPCFDIAGIVSDSNGVDGFEKGDKVFARLKSKSGEAAQSFVATDASVVAKVPAGLSFEEAAAIPLAGLTAMQGLRDFAGLNLQNDARRILVIGASGGVGHFVVQIAHAAGAHVTAVCGTNNVTFVKSLGANEVIDYRKQSSLKSEDDVPYDIIYDCVGETADFDDILKPGGIYVTPAANFRIMMRAIQFWRRRKVKTFLMKPSRNDLDFLSSLYTNGSLKVKLDSTFAFEDLPKAFERSLSGRSVGKVVTKGGH